MKWPKTIVKEAAAVFTMIRQISMPITTMSTGAGATRTGLVVVKDTAEDAAVAATMKWEASVLVAEAHQPEEAEEGVSEVRLFCL